MKIPNVFWENFELVAMFGLFGLIIGGGDIGIPGNITGFLFIFGMIGIVVGKTRFVRYLAGLTAGCLSMNDVADGNNGEQISTHLDLFFDETSKVYYNYEVDEKGKPIRMISWTQTFFLNKLSYIKHHNHGLLQALDVECFGPPLTSADFGKCDVSLLATSFPFGRTLVCTLYDKNQSVMDEDGIKHGAYTLESARSRYALVRRQTRPMPNIPRVVGRTKA